MALPARDVVTGPDGRPFLVRSLPKGGLKELTPTSGALTWLSTVPLALSVLGLFLNKIVFHGRWVVLASPVVHGEPVGVAWTVEARDLGEANQVAEELTGRIRAGTATGA